MQTITTPGLVNILEAGCGSGDGDLEAVQRCILGTVPCTLCSAVYRVQCRILCAVLYYAKYCATLFRLHCVDVKMFTVHTALLLPIIPGCNLCLHDITDLPGARAALVTALHWFNVLHCTALHSNALHCTALLTTIIHCKDYGC